MEKIDWGISQLRFPPDKNQTIFYVRHLHYENLYFSPSFGSELETTVTFLIVILLFVVYCFEFELFDNQRRKKIVQWSHVTENCSQHYYLKMKGALKRPVIPPKKSRNSTCLAFSIAKGSDETLLQNYKFASGLSLQLFYVTLIIYWLCCHGRHFYKWLLQLVGTFYFPSLWYER